MHLYQDFEALIIIAVTVTLYRYKCTHIHMYIMPIISPLPMPLSKRFIMYIYAVLTYDNIHIKCI